MEESRLFIRKGRTRRHPPLALLAFIFLVSFRLIQSGRLFFESFLCFAARREANIPSGSASGRLSTGRRPGPTTRVFLFGVGVPSFVVASYLFFIFVLIRAFPLHLLLIHRRGSRSPPYCMWQWLRVYPFFSLL